MADRRVIASSIERALDFTALDGLLNRHLPKPNRPGGDDHGI